MAPPETIFHCWISTQHWLLNFGEFFPSSSFLSSPTAYHGSPSQVRDSLHPPLGGFTCYFLGIPGKYPGIHTCRLSVNSENAPPSHMPVLPGRATMGTAYPLSISVLVPWESSQFWTLGLIGIIQLELSQFWTLNFQSTKWIKSHPSPQRTIYWNVSSKIFRLWSSQKPLNLIFCCKNVLHAMADGLTSYISKLSLI
jgi:hypothetical protein